MHSLVQCHKLSIVNIPPRTAIHAKAIIHCGALARYMLGMVLGDPSPPLNIIEKKDTYEQPFTLTFDSLCLYPLLGCKLSDTHIYRLG